MSELSYDGPIMSIEPRNQIVSKSKRFATYTVRDYIAYCACVRESLLLSSEHCLEDKKFRRKQFVHEMEILAKVCAAEFGQDNEQVKVRYLDKPLADGEVILESESFYVEITSTKDHLLTDFVADELAKGRVISFSGHTGNDVARLRKAGSGCAVELEKVTSLQAKLVDAVTDRIGKKVKKEWTNKHNWLCIVIDDYAHWDEAAHVSLFEVTEQFRDALTSKHIQKIWFVGLSPDNADLPLKIDLFKSTSGKREMPAPT